MKYLFYIIIIWIILAGIGKSKRKNRSYKRNYNRSHKRNQSTPKDDNWKSEWTWDEENQTWVHPKSGAVKPIQIEVTKPEESIQNEKTAKNEEPVPVDASAFHPSHLLTKFEYQQYFKMREFLDKKGYLICPKVRMLDLVQPNNGTGYMTRLHKIQAKHVDFVITDNKLHIKAIFELDDSSHDGPERQEVDKFKDEVLTKCGYKVIRSRYVTEETFKEL